MCVSSASSVCSSPYASPWLAGALLEGNTDRRCALGDDKEESNSDGSSGEPTVQPPPGEPYMENIRSTVSDDFLDICMSTGGRSGVGGAVEYVAVVVGDGRVSVLDCGWIGEGGRTTREGDAIDAARRRIRKELPPPRKMIKVQVGV